MLKASPRFQSSSGRAFLGAAALLLPALFLAARHPDGGTGDGPPPPARNLILMIPDGFGPASLGLARGCSEEPLALDGIVVGTCGTEPAAGRVTDSAAGATAYACGVKTRNGAIGVDAGGQSVPTLLERAEERGLATGLVTTTSITHATPAAFSARSSRVGTDWPPASTLMAPFLVFTPQA